MQSKGFSRVFSNTTVQKHIYKYTTMCKIDGWWEPVIKYRKLSWVLCNDLEGWDGGVEVGGRSKREGLY